MKKILALLLALTLCGAPALAANWAEGRSPAKPYAGVPEVDLATQIGYMVFYPNDKEGYDLKNGGRTLHIYLPRDDAEAGEGRLFLATQDGEVWRTAMNNTESVVRREMTERELDSLLWGGGTCFEITVPKSLELGKSYFVNIEKGAIVANGGAVTNPDIGGTDSWKFDVTGDYGVSNMEYRRPVDGGKYEGEIASPVVGDEVRMDVTLAGDAKMAVLYANHGSVSFDGTMVEESGEVVGKVLADDPSFGLVFLDAEGKELLNIEF